MPVNACCEALIAEFAYHSLLKLDKSRKTQNSASRPWKIKTGRKGIRDRFTRAAAHFWTIEAVPLARAISPPS